MEPKPLFTLFSNEQVTFHEHSVKPMDSICESYEQACSLLQTKSNSFNFIESNKENIDIKDALQKAKGQKFNEKNIASNILKENCSDQMADIQDPEQKSKFTCSHCQAIFSQQDHMNYHIKIVHKINFSVPHQLSVNCNTESDSNPLKTFDGKKLTKSDVHQGNIAESYNCSKCSYVTASNTLLVKHLQDLHNISKNHPCPECDETFSYLKHLKTHVKSKHCHILCYTCPKCPLTFHSRTIMKNHFFKKHSTSKEIFCQLCFESFSQHSSLKKHFRAVHDLHGYKLKKALYSNQASNKNLKLIEDDSASSNVIKKVKSFDEGTDFNSISVGIVPGSSYERRLDFEKPDQLSNIIKSESAEIIISDEYKEKFLAAKETLLTDDLVSFDKYANEYSCCICLLTFSSKKEVISHKDMHTEGNDRMCFDCNKFFPQTLLLRDHIDNLHKSLNIFTCDICQDTFFSKDCVSAHLKKCMMNLKCFTQSFCDICSTVFASKENLVQHIKSVHQKIRPFLCSDCGKSFYSRQKVQRHARAVHEKLKPYGCHECDKFFSTTGNRKQHIDAVHKNIRLHICEICLLSFSNRASMKQHVMTVHMKIKPFSCSYCDASFSLKVICQQHEYSVHLKLKLYKCEKCGVSYGWQRSLSKHRCSVDHYEV